MPHPVEEALEEAELWPIQEYVRQSQATIDEYITARPVYELCTGRERFKGTSHLMWW